MIIKLITNYLETEFQTNGQAQFGLSTSMCLLFLIHLLQGSGEFGSP